MNRDIGFAWEMKPNELLYSDMDPQVLYRSKTWLDCFVRYYSTPYQILGHSTISSVRDGTSFVCLLENGELVIRPIRYEMSLELLLFNYALFRDKKIWRLHGRRKAAFSGKFEYLIKTFLRKLFSYNRK